MQATDIASRFGLQKYPRSWRGRCPCCDYGGNTFSVRAGRNGEALVYCANGCDRENLIEAVARATGQLRPEPKVEADDAAARHRKQERALRLWRNSDAVTGTLADRYLTARGLAHLTASPALRFRGDCPHPERGRLPALVALVTNAADQPVAVHRTFLGSDGRKARVEPAKASLGPVWGGAIRLDLFTAEMPLVIGEGIESSASAGRLMGLPAWAALSAGNLAKGLVLPPSSRRVVIAADPDKAGEDAARTAALRWSAEGRNVEIARPNGVGDFNDTLRSNAHA